MGPDGQPLEGMMGGQPTGAGRQLLISCLATCHAAVLHVSGSSCLIPASPPLPPTCHSSPTWRWCCCSPFGSLKPAPSSCAQSRRLRCWWGGRRGMASWSRGAQGVWVSKVSG